ncbi:MAG TPA: hypothetical protein VM222_01205 [Planctomycetota bacterium]|nr:hypothetical protein [Planctomycetota bacterium]
MDVFVTFPATLDVSADVIEDTLDDAIGERGEVAGGGVGPAGMTLELDVEDDVAPREIVDLILGALKGLGLTPEKIVVNGVTFGR